MLTTAMTTIEAETSIAATPAAIWAAVLDYERWGAWAPPPDAAAGGRRVTLQAVEPLDGPVDRVGSLRCVLAAVDVPLLGARNVRWVEQVTDVAAPWTIEYEA